MTKNAKRLRKALMTLLAPVDVKLRRELVDIVIGTTDFGNSPLSDAPLVKNRYRHLFCPFCGLLHELTECQAPGVEEYQRDPQAYISRYVPAVMRKPIPTEPKRHQRAALVVTEPPEGSLTLLGHPFEQRDGPSDLCKVCGQRRTAPMHTIPQPDETQGG